MPQENFDKLKSLLDKAFCKYHSLEFIDNDPIQIPHLYTKKQDIEIAGLLTATLSWGNRKNIIKACNNLMHRMDNAPYDYIKNFNSKSSKSLDGFVYRTFNDIDLKNFIFSLHKIYSKNQSLETLFKIHEDEKYVFEAIERFRFEFIKYFSDTRTLKHVSSPMQHSASKRLCMYLRWMVRKNSEIDFGLWDQISPSKLCIPLDVHTGRVARDLGLLSRNQNDKLSVELLTETLKQFDINDPVKYDFALFGIGVNNKN